MSYEASFEAAVQFSLERGFVVPNFSLLPAVHGGPEIEENLLKLLRTRLGTAEIDPRDIAGQCIAVHTGLRAEINGILGGEGVLTIGEIVSPHGKRWYFCTPEEIDVWLRDGHPTPLALQFHAWLTFPGMHVVDLTLLATILAKQLAEGQKEGYFGVISRLASQVVGFNYHPVAVGNDIPERIGLERHAGIIFL